MEEQIPSKAEEFQIESSKMNVFLRIRPLKGHETQSKNYDFDSTNNKVMVTKKENKREKKTTYKFSKLLSPSTTQNEAYKLMLKASMFKILSGYGSSLTLGYGVTNSGKTYTMTGEYNVADKKGLLLRYVQDLLYMKAYLNFKESNSQSEKFSEISPLLREKFSNIYEQRGRVYHQECGNLNLVDIHIRFEVVEIYNNKVYDLIQLTKLIKKNKVFKVEKVKKKALKKLKEHNGTVKVIDLNSKTISNYDQFISLLDKTQLCKNVADNKINDQSSRSHTLYKIHLDYVYKSEDVLDSPLCVNYMGCMQLADLAGSERLGNTLDLLKDPAQRKLRKAEAIEINKSLSNLKRCFEHKLQKSLFQQVQGSLSSSDKKKQKSKIQPVNYRASKLTLLFKEAFENNWDISLICAMDPSERSYLESQRSLEFCSQMKDIKMETSGQYGLALNMLKKRKTAKGSDSKYRMVITQLKQQLNEKDQLIYNMTMEMQKIKEALQIEIKDDGYDTPQSKISRIQPSENISKASAFTFGDESGTVKKTQNRPHDDGQDTKSKFNSNINSQLKLFSQMKLKKFDRLCLRNLEIKQNFLKVNTRNFREWLTMKDFFVS